MLGEESKDDSDSHTIFNEQNKCKASTEMVRIILSTCLHRMEKSKCFATVECLNLFPPYWVTSKQIHMWNAAFLRNEQ
jgi:hypothetical protein